MVGFGAGIRVQLARGFVFVSCFGVSCVASEIQIGWQRKRVQTTLLVVFVYLILLIHISMYIGVVIYAFVYIT